MHTCVCIYVSTSRPDGKRASSGRTRRALPSPRHAATADATRHAPHETRPAGAARARSAGCTARTGIYGATLRAHMGCKIIRT